MSIRSVLMVENYGKLVILLALWRSRPTLSRHFVLKVENYEKFVIY